MAAFNERTLLTFKVVYLLFIFINLQNVVEGACKLHDAAWETGKGPLVTQPSKNDPAKVKVDWSNIIKNARCVDEYFLLLWKKNTAKEAGEKISIANKGTVSFIAEVEACVEYNFVMEYLENDIIHQDREQSVATVFKTEAVPVMRSKDKSNFHVGYFFDVAKGVNDLNKVVIKFPKKIIEHASCIKHLEVSGRINTGPSGNPGQQQQHSATAVDSKVLDMMYPTHDHSHGWHGRGSFNQSGIRTKREATTTTTAPTPTTTKATAPMGVVNLLAAATVSGTTVPGSLTVFVPPPFLFDNIEAIVQGVEPCKSYIFTMKVISPQNLILAEIQGLELPPLPEIDDYHPPSLSKLFQIETNSPSQSIQLKNGLGVPHTCLPTFFEAVDRHMQRLEEDITFHVKKEFESNMMIEYFRQEFRNVKSAHLKLLGCKCYSPTINLTSTDSSVVARFPNLFGQFHFEGVHQSKPYFTNPSLKPAFLPSQAGFNQLKPDISSSRVKRSSGKIPCYGQHLSLQNQLDEEIQQIKDEQLDQLELVPAASQHPPGLGHLFAGHSNLKRKKRFIGNLLQGSSTTTAPSTTAKSNGETASTTKSAVESQPPSSDFSDIQSELRLEDLAASAVVPAKTFYLYWEPSDKSWVVSEQLGNGKVLLKSSKNSRSACPADPESLKTWTYSATLQWKNDPTMKFEC